MALHLCTICHKGTDLVCSLLGHPRRLAASLCAQMINSTCWTCIVDFLQRRAPGYNIVYALVLVKKWQMPYKTIFNQSFCCIFPSLCALVLSGDRTLLPIMYITLRRVDLPFLELTSVCLCEVLNCRKSLVGALSECHKAYFSQVPPPAFSIPLILWDWFRAVD